jgi:hypothetical protein
MRPWYRRCIRLIRLNSLRISFRMQDRDEGPTDDGILNYATPEKLAAYSWLDSGAEVILDPL